MSMRWWSFGVALALVATGCGNRRGGHGGDGDGDIDGDGTGSSGLARGDLVGELSENDIETLCEWTADQQGGPGTTECDGGLSVTVKTVSECFDDTYQAECDATVGDIEDCMAAIDGDPCAILAEFPPECSPLLGCGQASP